MKVTSPNSHILGVLFVFEFTSLAYGDGKGNAIGPGQNVVEIYHLLSQPFLAAIDADREMAKTTLKFIQCQCSHFEI